MVLKSAFLWYKDVPSNWNASLDIIFLHFFCYKVNKTFFMRWLYGHGPLKSDFQTLIWRSKCKIITVAPEINAFWITLDKLQ